MNARKIVKFNLYMSGILLVIVVLMFLTASIAYFTDTKQATATLTSGNVKIVLSEAAVKKDASGNLVAGILVLPMSKILRKVDKINTNMSRGAVEFIRNSVPMVEKVGSINILGDRRGGCTVSIKDARYNIDRQLAEAIEI